MHGSLAQTMKISLTHPKKQFMYTFTVRIQHGSYNNTMQPCLTIRYSLVLTLRLNGKSWTSVIEERESVNWLAYLERGHYGTWSYSLRNDILINQHSIWTNHNSITQLTWTHILIRIQNRDPILQKLSKISVNKILKLHGKWVLNKGIWLSLQTSYQAKRNRLPPIPQT